MKVGLICCGRLENRYAVEFVEYYKQLGFNHIHIIDNNYDSSEYFEDVLQSYINEGFITIYDYRNFVNEGVQWYAYSEVYDKIHNQYDWIFFCDFDEFLTLQKDKTIQDYLSRECFKDYNQILINWKIYTDNDLIYDDGRSCLERFTTESNYTGWKDGLVKPIIRTNIKDIYISGTVHIFKDNNSILKDSSCNSCGTKANLLECGCIYPDSINFKLSYIKHFTTKTIDEYVNRKFKRGTGDCTYNDYKQIDKNLLFDYFFEINNKTKEKINYLIEHNLKYNKK